MVLERARRDPATLAVALDANAAGMAGASNTADRECRANALFVRAAVESLPPALSSRADEVTVTLPWGTLLAAVARPGTASLAAIRGLCQLGAAFDAVFSWEPERDARQLARLGLSAIGTEEWSASLAQSYAAAGFRLGRLARGGTELLWGVETTWAKQLRRSAGREVVVLSAIAVDE